jgi:hypothetical protein
MEQVTVVAAPFLNTVTVPVIAMLDRANSVPTAPPDTGTLVGVVAVDASTPGAAYNVFLFSPATPAVTKMAPAGPP